MGGFAGASGTVCRSLPPRQCARRPLARRSRHGDHWRLGRLRCGLVVASIATAGHHGPRSPCPRCCSANTSPASRPVRSRPVRGPLGILIPPSTMMVLYCFLTEQSLPDALYGGRHSRAHRGRLPLYRDRHRGALQPRGRTRWRAGKLARALRRDGQELGRRSPHFYRDRRDLWRWSSPSPRRPPSARPAPLCSPFSAAG